MIATEYQMMPGQDPASIEDLPAGSTICQVAFVADPATREVLLAFPEAIGRYAVRLQQNAGDAEADLSILSIPTSVQDEGRRLNTARAWVDASVAQGANKSQMMTFQGAQILWSDTRLAVLASADRLDSVRTALIEVAFYDAELRDIERTLGETWPQMETDLPLAFEFEGKSLPKRRELQKRFGQVLLIRARLARINPHVHCPHVHPPTLASQVSERVRERNRMAHRHESLGEQIEVFERVYEMCGQRVSDFVLTRSGNTLEWVIIVLLFTQILLSLFEYLTTTGTVQ